MTVRWQPIGTHFTSLHDSGATQAAWDMKRLLILRWRFAQPLDETNGTAVTTGSLQSPYVTSVLFVPDNEARMAT